MTPNRIDDEKGKIVKPKVGDVVVITNDTRFYAQIGIVKDVNPICVKVVLSEVLSSSSYGLLFLHEDLEVIDHIDNEF